MHFSYTLIGSINLGYQLIYLSLTLYGKWLRWAKNVLPESEIFLWMKEKKNFFVENLDEWRRLEVREKARKLMLLVMSLRLSDHKVLHIIASSSSFFRFRSDFLAFFARVSCFKLLELKEFNKTIIPFALVGYGTGYSQLGATRLVAYLPSHIQRALME